MSNITKTDQGTPCHVIDAALLGRPVHLLHLFAERLRDDLVAVMRLPACRRYWGAHLAGAAAFSRAGAEAGQQRWLAFDANANTIGFAIERKLLLSVLNHRYGRKHAAPVVAAVAADGADGAPAPAPAAAPAVAPDPLAVPVTATEERLALLLGQQLVAALLARIGANPGEPAKADAAPELKARAGMVPAKGGWLVGVDVHAAPGGESGRFWFALDQNLMAAVLQGLKPERKRAGKSLRNALPLATHLRLRIDGRLVSKEVTLGALLDLRVGDVIPISMNRTDVLLEESRLFTAAVSEHKNKLCLTSFEDAE